MVWHSGQDGRSAAARSHLNGGCDADRMLCTHATDVAVLKLMLGSWGDGRADALVTVTAERFDKSDSAVCRKDSHASLVQYRLPFDFSWHRTRPRILYSCNDMR